MIPRMPFSGPSAGNSLSSTMTKHTRFPRPHSIARIPNIGPSLSAEPSLSERSFDLRTSQHGQPHQPVGDERDRGNETEGNARLESAEGQSASRPERRGQERPRRRRREEGRYEHDEGMN